MACSVTAELEPTVAVPVPDPLDVKYANATPATARAQVQPSAIKRPLLGDPAHFFPPSLLMDGLRRHDSGKGDIDE